MNKINQLVRITYIQYTINFKIEYNLCLLLSNKYFLDIEDHNKLRCFIKQFKNEDYIVENI